MWASNIMADIKLDFSNCNVSIGKMFDIHDNENVNIYSNSSEEKKLPQKKTRQNNLPKEKQHGLDYPVFSKGAGVTDNHIKAVYRYLTSRGWISTQTSEYEFLRLFSKNSNPCEIIWMGQDKQGSNPEKKLGISALYCLFKSLHEERLINSEAKIGPILESHFVDKHGHFISDVSNVSKTSKNANDVIANIVTLMSARPNAENIETQLLDDMESKYDRNDRQDLSIHNRH